MTAGSRISIINIAELQNEHFAKEEDSMSTVKMGLTIEEAAECTGIRRNTMRKLVEWVSCLSLKLDEKRLSAAIRWSIL